MKTNRYTSVRDWISDCRTLVRNDWDNVILFTGPEGSGKSTVAVQVLRALDDSFDVDRVHFGIANFLAYAPSTGRRRAVLGDEIEAQRRNAMSRLTRDLIEFLKDCRGLNLHIGFCFPHEEIFEGAILNHRVRWKVHVPERGRWILYQRVERTYRKKGGEEVTKYLWVERGQFTFRENSGPLWDGYRKKKGRHMESLGGRYKELVEAPATGIIQDEAVAAFTTVLRDVGEWQDPHDAPEPAPVTNASRTGLDRDAATLYFTDLRARRRGQDE